MDGEEATSMLKIPEGGRNWPNSRGMADGSLTLEKREEESEKKN